MPKVKKADDPEIQTPVAEVAEPVAEQADAPESASGPIAISADQTSTDIPVNIDRSMPWGESNLTPPVAVNSADIAAAVDDGEQIVLESSDGVIGRLNDRGWTELGWLCTLPADFVRKLNPSVAASVINDRLHSVPPIDLNVFKSGESVSHFIRSTRQVCSYQEVAQMSYDTFARIEPNVAIKGFSINPDAMRLRMTGERQERITAEKGDVLTVGIDVTYTPGHTHEVALFVERLVCTNGMTASAQMFSWTQRTATSRNHQLLWVAVAVEEVHRQYQAIVEKSREMANTKYQGEARHALAERVSAMRLPQRMLPHIFEAYDQEPGDTEWHLLNAISRFATHSDAVTGQQRRAIQHGAGDWAINFDMVTARIPRPVANRVGATILDIS